MKAIANEKTDKGRSWNLGFADFEKLGFKSRQKNRSLITQESVVII